MTRPIGDTSHSPKFEPPVYLEAGKEAPTELELVLNALGPRATRVDIVHVITRDDQRIERNVTIECGEVAR